MTAAPGHLRTHVPRKGLGECTEEGSCWAPLPHLPDRVAIMSYREVSELNSTAVLAIDGAFEGPLSTGLLGWGWLTPTLKEEFLPRMLPGLADGVPVPVGKWGLSGSCASDGR